MSDTDEQELLDKFATSIMQGLVSAGFIHKGFSDNISYLKWAKKAYAVAQAMIIARRATIELREP